MRRLAKWTAIGLLALGSWSATAQAQSEDSTASAVPTDPDARMSHLESQIEGMTEQMQTLVSDTDKLKRFKFSGYIQARWETAENSTDSVRVTGSPATLTPANVSRFYIRRGRLKLTYDANPLSQAVVYFDGGTDRTIRLLEAYVQLLDPWTSDHRHQLWVGQMNVPFGYEIERSSSVRELPERSRAENVLFAGERDRGIKLVNPWSPKFETVVALLNGGGINHPDFPNSDPTTMKDFVGRARVSQGVFDAAASYYTGKNVTALTGPDVETDKTRLGFDAQIFYELPSFGGGSLRGEFYQGENVNADSVKALVVAPTSGNPVTLLKPGADPSHLATDFTGWYAMWVQSVGEKLQLAARYDVFDPNVDLDHDQFERLGLGLNYFYDGFTRITVSYDIPTTDVSVGAGNFEDPKDNLWTIQFQHKF